jgi:hypothetical protein
MLGIPCYVASLVSPFAVVSTRDAKSSSTPSHSPLPGGLVAIRRGEYRRSAGLSPRGMLAPVNARFISADSGLELEIAANGDLSAGPVPHRLTSARRGRFVETSDDVIKRALIKNEFARQHQSSNFCRFLSTPHGSPRAQGAYCCFSCAPSLCQSPETAGKGSPIQLGVGDCLVVGVFFLPWVCSWLPEVAGTTLRRVGGGVGWRVCLPRSGRFEGLGL